jgi:mRNA-degrading endonuclease HigB of HigAB toxin-antitoxin module
MAVSTFLRLAQKGILFHFVPVRIITAGRIKEWTKLRPAIAAQLLRWLAVMGHLTDCRSFNDLRAIFNTEDRVTTRKGNAVCVFNLGHGKSAYRLITAIHFNTQIVYVLRLLNYAEYDKQQWKGGL